MTRWPTTALRPRRAVRPRQALRARRALRAGRASSALVAAGLALAGCATSGQAAAPTWVPAPAYTLEPTPANPGSAANGAPNRTSTGTPSPSSPSTSGSAANDPSVVATGLTSPIGIGVLPDGTALVGQRTTGVIVQVQPIADQPVKTVRTVTGIDASGDGGLLDLAISPTYDQDHLIYAYITTPTDNRVVDFTLTGAVTPVFTGIPKASTGNAGRIAFAADGNLLIGTGDAGQPALAQNPASLAGKVLEVNSVGQSLAPGSPVLTQGQHALAGLCVDHDTGAVFETEPSVAAGSTTAASGDEVNVLTRGGDYGWPNPQPGSVAASATLPTGSDGHVPVASGCAVTGGVLYVASLDATTLYATDITGTATSTKLDSFVTSLTGQYGRLITVVADPDGSLWLATSNKGVDPAATGSSAADERILHIQPAGGGADSQA